MSDRDNEKILGIIILVGLGLMILVALLQVLTVIFMSLTIATIISTIILVILGFMDEWERKNYFMYAGIAFLCIILFFAAGRATYSASEALLNNEMTRGVMEFTALFFQIQIEKQKIINELENTQIDIISNLTNSIPD